MAASPERNGVTVLGRPRAARDAGFSLVEVMVALVVFAMIGAAVVTLVVDSLHSTRASQSRVRAASLTAQEVEAVRAGLRSGGALGNTATLTFPWSDPSCAAASPTCTRVVDGQPFVLTRSVTAVAADATHAGRLLVTTTATWPSMNGVAPVVTSTVMTARGITPGPAGNDTPGSSGSSSSAGTSAVSVTVTGSASVPYAYKSVTLAGPTGALQTTTDATGVALFTGLTPATYTASVAQTGYIDPAGNSTASASVTTSANATATVSLKYAQAATVIYTVNAPTGYTPGGTSPISVLNTDANTTKTVTPAASTGTTTVTTWPTNTARAWNGTCSADQNNYTSFAATAGSTVSKTLGLTGVQVTVSKSLVGVLGSLFSSPISGAQLIAVKAADTGCPASVTDPVGGTAAGSVVYFPTTTNSSGIAKVALPPGTWTIKAVGYSLGLTGGLLGWPSTTLTVDATGTGTTTSLAMNMGLV